MWIIYCVKLKKRNRSKNNLLKIDYLTVAAGFTSGVSRETAKSSPS